MITPGLIQNLALVSIPILNIAISAILVRWGDKHLDDTIKSLHMQGKIYKPSTVTTKEDKDESVPLESEKNNTTSREKPVVKFEELSIEEQISCLEEMKKQFLGLKENIISQDVLDVINNTK